MEPPDYDTVLKLAATLPPADRRRLVAALTSLLRAEATLWGAPPQWRDIRGTVPYPALGEDAQTWIARARDEWDARERTGRSTA